MAKQVDRVCWYGCSMRQPDGTYVHSLSGIEANASDPSDTTIPSWQVPGIVRPTFTGASTQQVLADAAVSNAKSAAGVV